VYLVEGDSTMSMVIIVPLKPSGKYAFGVRSLHHQIISSSEGAVLVVIGSPLLLLL
jgi:hypothetical protein